MLLEPLINFELRKYYQNEPKFNGVYSRNNLPEIKDRTCVINIDEYKSIGTNYTDLYVSNINVTYFDSFGVANILKEIKKFIWNKNIITSIYIIQACNSIMCRYFCTGIIDFMLKY